MRKPEDTIQRTRPVAPPTQPTGLPPVDRPMSTLRMRQQRRSGRSRRGARSLLGWVAVGLVVLVIVGLIAAPLVYRSLRPELQERINRYLPFMTIFAPQRQYTADTLPTVQPGSGGGPSAADLLLTPQQGIPAAGDVEVTATPGLQLATPTPLQPLSSQPQAGALVSTPTPTVPQPTATLALPTATWTPLPPPTLAATEVVMLPLSSRLSGFTHIYQTWNNCGPATLTMALTYYGWTGTQAQAAEFLKPDAEDKNVSPGQMVRYVNENTGVRALVRYGGDLDMLRRLVLEGFPVVVEVGFMPEGYDWMGHYRLIVGYDDNQSQLYVYDSFLGHGNFQGLPVSYDQFNRTWQHFNRLYIVLYDQGRENELRQILGPQADLTYNAEHALEVARQEAAADAANPFAWFNMGTSYVMLGRYEEAAAAYDQARNAGPGLPWRMLWYQFGPFEAYYEVGRYDDVLALVQANLGTTPYVEETYYWTGMVYLARGQTDAARAQFNQALQHNRNFTPAQDALVQMQVAQSGGG